jgi:hypothetical protein
MLRLAVVAVLLVMSSSGTAVAAATCRLPAGARQIKITSRAVAYVHEEEYFGCLKSAGRRVFLAEVPFDGDGRVRLAGRYAAAVTWEYDKYSSEGLFADFAVWDLRTGRRYAHVEHGDFPESDGPFGRPLDVRLGPRGGLLYLLDPGPTIEVWHMVGAKRRRIDHGPTILRRFSLEDDGRTYWYRADSSRRGIRP